jgi:hypothetical protein
MSTHAIEEGYDTTRRGEGVTQGAAGTTAIEPEAMIWRSVWNMQIIWTEERYTK